MNPLREGLLKERIPEAQVMVIFGISGDLTQRKLIPALYTLARERLLPASFAVVGVSRTEFGGPEAFRDGMKQACNRFARRRPVDDALWSGFAGTLHYLAGEFDDPACYANLKGKLAAIEAELGIPGARLYYLATPPSAYPLIVDGLKQSGLVARAREPWTHTRVIVEKPFGRDLESARELNRRLKLAFREPQIYRIDHYLGKETVQNMLAFRFGNGIFEPIWNQRHVEHVQITAAESAGVEGRGAYFEEAGILRDMVQNHLLQALCLTAMEPPVALESDAVRDEKVKLLRSLRPLPPERLDRHIVRAQYTAGHVLGQSVPGYRQERGVNPASTRETFVALRLYVDNWRWGNVPFFLRTAKRMPKKVTAISVRFRDPPHVLFRGNGKREPVPNVLTIRVQPDEGISLHFGSKVPGPTMDLAPVNMEFRYGTSFGGEPPEAYERLVLDAMLGDSTLFIRDDETEAAWDFITRILRGWEAQTRHEIPVYAAGTWGPAEADELFAAAGVAWSQP